MPKIYEINGQGVTILLDTITEIGTVLAATVTAQNGYSLDFSKPTNSFYLSANSF